MKRTLTFLQTLALLATAAAAEELPRSALGNSAVFTVEAGLYGELFPDGKAAEADRPVLALDVVGVADEDAESQRMLVPTTLDKNVESEPWLLYNAVNDVVNVFWQSSNGKRTWLFAATYADGELNEVHEIYQQRGDAPKMALTRDTFELELGDETISGERTVLHLAWLEDVDGERLVQYSPVIFVDGSLVNWQGIFTLASLDGAAETPTHLGEVLQLASHDTRNQVTITYGSPATGTLTSLGIGIIPVEVVLLSDEVREIVNTTPFDPEDITTFADVIGANIIGIGARRKIHFAPPVLDYIAAQVEVRILETGEGYAASERAVLATDLRQYVLDLVRALFSVTQSETGGTMALFEVSLKAAAPGEPEPRRTPANHILDVQRVFERPFPVVEGDENMLLVSNDGQRLIAVWLDPEVEAANVLRYVEWQEEAWSEPRAFHVGDLTLAAAVDLLRQRTR